MAKFAMYVVDLEEGTVSGSNDVEAIEAFAKDEPERFLIIHATNGHYQEVYAEAREIEALPEDDELDEDED